MKKIFFLIIILTLNLSNIYSQDFTGIIEIKNNKCFKINSLKLVFHNNKQIVLQKLSKYRFEIPLEKIKNIDNQEKVKLVVNGKNKYFSLKVLTNSFNRCVVKLNFLGKKRSEIDVSFTNCSGVVFRSMATLKRRAKNEARY